MRMLGWVGLLLALLVVGLVAKRQMSEIGGTPAGAQAPVAADASATTAPVRGQGAQVRQDVQRQLDQAMQRPRVPEDP